MLTLAVFVTSVMLIAACGARSGSSPPATTGDAAEKTHARTTPALDADPSARQAAGRLLPEVPEFPAYPGASVLGSAERNRPAAAKQGHFVEWTTTDSVPKVMAWYQKTLQDRRWTYVPPTDGVTHSQLGGFRSPDGTLEGTLEVELEDGITRITVVLKPSL